MPTGLFYFRGKGIYARAVCIVKADGTMQLLDGKDPVEVMPGETVIELAVHRPEGEASYWSLALERLSILTAVINSSGVLKALIGEYAAQRDKLLSPPPVSQSSSDGSTAGDDPASSHSV